MSTAARLSARRDRRIGRLAAAERAARVAARRAERKLTAALDFLGTRWVLHPQYRGRYAPASLDLQREA